MKVKNMIDPPVRSPAPAVRHKRMPVLRMQILRSRDHKRKDCADLQNYHGVVCLCRFADSTNQQNCQEHHDQECWEVESHVPARRNDSISV